MIDAFPGFLMRQGEPAVLAIIENWEFHVGVRGEITVSLEDRWDRMMQLSRESQAA